MPRAFWLQRLKCVSFSMVIILHIQVLTMIVFLSTCCRFTVIILGCYEVITLSSLHINYMNTSIFIGWMHLLLGLPLGNMIGICFCVYDEIIHFSWPVRIYCQCLVLKWLEGNKSECILMKNSEGFVQPLYIWSFLSKSNKLSKNFYGISSGKFHWGIMLGRLLY